METKDGLLHQPWTVLLIGASPNLHDCGPSTMELVSDPGRAGGSKPSSNGKHGSFITIPLRYLSFRNKWQHDHLRRPGITRIGSGQFKTYGNVIAR